MQNTLITNLLTATVTASELKVEKKFWYGTSSFLPSSLSHSSPLSSLPLKTVMDSLENL